MRSIELLAPARNLVYGIAAIDHGADAVYIGPESFGARASAGNSVEDIGKLCRYAHIFNAKVYVTINTIIYDKEINQVESMLRQLSDVGVDAILIQDMAVLERAKSVDGINLHASTQTDNRNAQKVEWLRSLGFKRVVLARELTIEEIREIHKSVPDIELEVFVHGALCVSYSGACYASEHCFHRSANRGECAQFCRLRFNLKDGTGHTVVKEKYLLSLKDMCRLNEINELLESGVTSLKIEGRLKDIVYVKNVVSAYHSQLNRIISQHPDKYCRSSVGDVEYTFTPNIYKTFNRGYTNYFLHGRQQSMASVNSPKSIGEYVGNIKEIHNTSFTVSSMLSFNNGDGLCFINKKHQLEGFRVNKVTNNRIYPAKMPADIYKGMVLYRNNDQLFERQMLKETAIRNIGLRMHLSSSEHTICLHLEDDRGLSTSVTSDIELPVAQKQQENNMRQQLSKLGNTYYKLKSLEIEEKTKRLFIPSSILSELRRKGIEQLTNLCLQKKHSSTTITAQNSRIPHKYTADEINVDNISNHIAQKFYKEIGITDASEAYEINKSIRRPIMTCRYCIRHELGYCLKNAPQKGILHEPLFLELSDGRRFKLGFDCKKCQMKVYVEE